MDWIETTINSALGLNTEELNLYQIGLRSAIIYLSALVMVRVIGDRRFIGKYAAFDVILSIIFGSTLSRAINGSSPFFLTIFAGWVLIGMHWLCSFLSYHFSSLEPLIKGKSRIIIQNGQLCTSCLRVSHISQKDLESVIRLQAQLQDFQDIEVARLESSGQISIILKKE